MMSKSNQAFLAAASSIALFGGAQTLINSKAKANTTCTYNDLIGTTTCPGVRWNNLWDRHRLHRHLYLEWSWRHDQLQSQRLHQHDYLYWSRPLITQGRRALSSSLRDPSIYPLSTHASSIDHYWRDWYHEHCSTIASIPNVHCLSGFWPGLLGRQILWKVEAMSKGMKHLIFSVRPSAVATPCNCHYSY